jgi:hypothetical protein
VWQYLRSVADFPGTRRTGATTLAMRGLLMAGVLAFPYPFWAIATRGGGIEARQSGSSIEVGGALFGATFVVLAGWALVLALSLAFAPRAWPGASREGALTAVGAGMGAVLLVGWAWFLSVTEWVCSHGRGINAASDVLFWGIYLPLAVLGGSTWRRALWAWPAALVAAAATTFVLRLAVLGGTHGCA